mmetsp:Transcript_1527/g.4509  ORF Transcript_1527/g.4509 Transcript_1527/m.4509 type:complete len:765 (-) Transcript_1527:442-2736(-)
MRGEVCRVWPPDARCQSGDSSENERAPSPCPMITTHATGGSRSRDLEQHIAVRARPVARLLAVGVRLRQLRLERRDLAEERGLVLVELLQLLALADELLLGLGLLDRQLGHRAHLLRLAQLELGLEVLDLLVLRVELAPQLVHLALEQVALRLHAREVVVELLRLVGVDDRLALEVRHVARELVALPLGACERLERLPGLAELALDGLAVLQVEIVLLARRALRAQAAALQVRRLLVALQLAQRLEQVALAAGDVCALVAQLRHRLFDGRAELLLPLARRRPQLGARPLLQRLRLRAAAAAAARAGCARLKVKLLELLEARLEERLEVGKSSAEELVVELGLVERVHLRLLDRLDLLLELRDPVHAEGPVELHLRDLALKLLLRHRLAGARQAAAARDARRRALATHHALRAAARHESRRSSAEIAVLAGGRECDDLIVVRREAAGASLLLLRAHLVQLRDGVAVDFHRGQGVEVPPRVQPQREGEQVHGDELEAQRPIGRRDVLDAVDERDYERVVGVQHGDERDRKGGDEQHVDADQIDGADVGDARVAREEGGREAAHPEGRAEERRRVAHLLEGVLAKGLDVAVRVHVRAARHLRGEDAGADRQQDEGERGLRRKGDGRVPRRVAVDVLQHDVEEGGHQVEHGAAAERPQEGDHVAPLVVRPEVLLSAIASEELGRVGEGRVDDEVDDGRDDDDDHHEGEQHVAHVLAAHLDLDLAIVHDEQALDALHVVLLNHVPVVLEADDAPTHRELLAREHRLLRG